MSDVIKVRKYEITRPVTLCIVNEENVRLIETRLTELDAGDTITYNYHNFTIDKNNQRIDDNVVYGLPIKPLPELRVNIHFKSEQHTMEIYAHDWQAYSNEEIIAEFTKTLNKLRK